MKRGIYVFLAVLTVLAMTMVSCGGGGGGGGGGGTKYTVTYNSNGGTPETFTATVKAGALAAQPEDPTKEGKTFLGWYQDEELTKPWNFGSYTVTGNITLYAKWYDGVVTTYTVTFDSQGGSAVAEARNIISGSKVAQPADPTNKSGEIFGGWFRGTEEDGTVTLGTVWNFGSDTVTADITLYAKWLPKDTETFIVTFNSDGGNYTPTRITGLVAGRTITEPNAPTKAGFEFGGWWVVGDSTEIQWNFATSTVSQSITLKAKWVAVVAGNITITFDHNTALIDSLSVSDYKDLLDDYTFEAKSIAKGAAIGTLPVYTADGVLGDKIVFVGWYRTAAADGTQVTATSTFDASATVYAKWVKFDPVTVTFNVKDNGGLTADFTEDDTPVTVHKGLSLGVKMPADAFKDGSTFIGWSTTKTATTGDFTSSTPVTANVTVYAIFKLDAGWDSVDKPMPADGEWIVLQNAWFPVYKFTLPAGKTWNDYDGITADVWVEDWNKATSARAVRVYGNFKPADFDLYKFNTGVTSSTGLTSFAVYNYNNGNGQTILSNLNGSGSGKTIKDFLTDTGAGGQAYVYDEVAKTYTKGAVVLKENVDFIPLSFKTDLSEKNSAYEADKRLPKAVATGPFYFGLGITNDDNVYNLEQIKNIKLLGKDGTDDLEPTPAYFKDSEGTEYPAFTGYDGGNVVVEGKDYNYSNGANGASLAYRGATKPTIVLEPPEPAKPAASVDLIVFDVTTLKPGEKNPYFSDAFENNYDGAHAIRLTIGEEGTNGFPTGLNLSSYATFTAVFKFYDEDGEEIPDNGEAGWGQLVFAKSVTGWDVVGDNYNNIGKMGTTNALITQATKDYASKITAVLIQNGGWASGQRAIELVKLVFHAPPTGVVITVSDGTRTDLVSGISGTANLVLSNGDLTLSAPAGLTSYSWKVNDEEKSTTKDLTLSAKTYIDKIGKKYTVSLVAKGAGKTYSKTIIVTVKE